MVSIVSFLSIFFIFTGENGLVCCFCRYGGIWASGKMVEAARATATVGEGVALGKMASSGMSSLLRDTCFLVAPSFISLVFILSFLFFLP